MRPKLWLKKGESFRSFGAGKVLNQGLVGAQVIAGDAEIARQEASLRQHWGHSNSIEVLKGIAREAGVPEGALDPERLGDQPEAALSTLIIARYRRRAAVLFQYVHCNTHDPHCPLVCS